MKRHDKSLLRTKFFKDFSEKILFHLQKRNVKKKFRGFGKKILRNPSHWRKSGGF